MSTDLSPRLAALGDDLERAIGEQLADELAVARREVRKRRLRRGGLVVGAAALLAVGGGVVAAANGLFSAHDIEVAMPASEYFLEGRTPSCEPHGDDTFRCVFEDGFLSPNLLDNPEAVKELSYQGRVSWFHDSKDILVGACESQDVIGEVWLCYLGHQVVDRGMVPEGLLGTYAPGPYVG